MFIIGPAILIVLLVAGTAPPAASDLDQCTARLKAIGRALGAYRQ
jgi:hypothetical protein